MKLKNFLIIVTDIELSKRFYREIFGLETAADFGENAVLTGGLVLPGENGLGVVDRQRRVPGRM